MKFKKLGLTTKILLALIIGALLGLIINYSLPNDYFKNVIIINNILDTVGKAFVRLLQMLVVPLVFCSLVCGTMAIGDIKKLGSIGIKTLLFYLSTTAIAIALALLTGNIINPGRNLNLVQDINSQAEAMQTTVKDTLLNIIPTNIFAGLSNGSMLQIIFFALILGVVLAKLKDRAEYVSKLFEQFNEVMLEMTLIVMEFAPIGVFFLVAKTFADTGFDAFLPMIKYMGAVLIALGIHCFIVYLSLLKLFTNLSPKIFIQNFFPVMAFAFSTATSNATIPMSIDTLACKLGVSKRVSAFTIPLGATINMDGTAIMQGVAVVFAAQAYNIDLTLVDYITVIATATLASIGTAGIPSVGLISLTMVFKSVGLPIEAIAIIMGVDRLLDMARTAVNITGDATCTLIVAKQTNNLDLDVYHTSHYN